MKCSSQIPKSFSFTMERFCEEATGREEGPGSAATQWDRRAPPGPTASTRPHPPARETLLMGCKHKDQGEGAGGSEIAGVHPCELAGCLMAQEQVMWLEPPLCLLLGLFPAAFSTISVLPHASQCTAAEQKRKMAC